jgi:hypothetical protein
MARFTTRELEALAAFAHRLGYEDLLDYEEGQEPDYTRAELERLAQEKLAASALFGSQVNNPDARSVWATNYIRGWRFGESDGYNFEEPTVDIEGIVAIDADDQEPGQEQAE